MALTERQMQLRIGALVLAAILLFMVFVLSIGQRSALFQERYSLWTAFESTEGVAVGSAVRLAGVTVGNVTKISFGRDRKDQNVVLTLAIERRVQDRIRQDSLASIGTIGLLGDKVLDLTVGSPETPVLQPGERLRSAAPIEYGELLRKGDQILNHVNSITASLDQFLSGKDPEVGRQNLGEALRSLRTSLVEIEKGQGLAHELIYGRAGTGGLASLDRTAQRLDALVAEIERGDGVLHGLIYGSQDETLGRLARSAEQLEQLTREARGTLGEVRTIVRDVREGDGLAHALVYDPKLPALLSNLGQETRETVGRLGRQGEATLAQLGQQGSALMTRLGDRADATLTRLDQAAARVDGLLASVERGEGLLPALLFDPQRKQVLTDLEAAAAGVRAASEEVKRLVDEVAQGEGTLGALIQDPTVYEDLSSVLRGANRSRLLRWLIRSMRERGTPPPAPTD